VKEKYRLTKLCSLRGGRQTEKLDGNVCTDRKIKIACVFELEKVRQKVYVWEKKGERECLIERQREKTNSVF